MIAAARLRYRKSMADNMNNAAQPEEASSTPLHIQVRETIRRQVKVGELIDKTGRLMTEAELGKHFGVSRITIRNAIKPLVDEGMFERERGRGTFLRTNQPENWVGRLMGFSETIRDAGYQPGAKVLLQGMTNRHDAGVRNQLRERAVWQLKRRAARRRHSDRDRARILSARHRAGAGEARSHLDRDVSRVRRANSDLPSRKRRRPSAPRSPTPPAPSCSASRPAAPCCRSSASPSTPTARPLELLRSVYLPDYFQPQHQPDAASSLTSSRKTSSDQEGPQPWQMVAKHPTAPTS